MLPCPLLGPIRLYSSCCNHCPLGACSWSTWGGFQGKYQRKQNAFLAPTPVRGRRKVDKPCKSEIMHPAINGITVVVILLASDLSERSRAFPGDAEQSVSGPCSSTKEKDGARAGQQRPSLCNAPQGSRPPLRSPCSKGRWQSQEIILEHGRLQGRVLRGYFCCFPSLQLTQWAFIVKTGVIVSG